LSEFLIQRCRFDISSFLTEIAIHQSIFIDEVALRKLDDLDGNNEGNRNHCVDKHEIGAVYDEGIKAN